MSFEDFREKVKENKGSCIAIIVVAFLVVLFLVCVKSYSSEHKIIGTWVCENIVDGYPTGMVIKADGTAIIDGNDSEWYIKNEKIFFDVSGLFESDKEYNFKLKGAKLYLDGFIYKKTNSSHFFDFNLSKGFKIKKEDEIIQDIVENDYRFYEYGVDVDSYEMINRLTDKENNNDFICVRVIGSSEQITYYARYELIYVYNNKEWVLDEYSCVDSQYEITGAPDNEILQEYFDEEYTGECVIDSCEKIDEGIYEYAFTQTDSESYEGLTVVCVGTINLNFTFEYEDDLSSGKCGFWYITEGEKDISNVTLSSDITGEWIYEEGNEHLYLTIYEATEKEVNYDFDLAFYETHVWGNEQHCELKTDVTKSKEWEFEDCGDYIVYKTVEKIFSIQWCGGLSDKDYYLEYRVYNTYNDSGNGGSGFYVDDRKLTRD